MLRHRIRSTEVAEAISNEEAEVLEDYPQDARGHSCLLFGLTDRGRILHMVMGVRDGWIITVYPPAETEPEAWSADFRRRSAR